MQGKVASEQETKAESSVGNDISEQGRSSPSGD
jgi:hypothetical protein